VTTVDDKSTKPPGVQKIGGEATPIQHHAPRSNAPRNSEVNIDFDMIRKVGEPDTRLLDYWGNPFRG